MLNLGLRMCPRHPYRFCEIHPCPFSALEAQSVSVLDICVGSWLLAWAACSSLPPLSVLLYPSPCFSSIVLLVSSDLFTPSSFGLLSRALIIKCGVQHIPSFLSPVFFTNAREHEAAIWTLCILVHEHQSSVKLWGSPAESGNGRKGLMDGGLQF